MIPLTVVPQMQAASHLPSRASIVEQQYQHAAPGLDTAIAAGADVLAVKLCHCAERRSVCVCRVPVIVVAELQDILLVQCVVVCALSVVLSSNGLSLCNTRQSCQKVTYLCDSSANSFRKHR